MEEGLFPTSKFPESGKYQKVVSGFSGSLEHLSVTIRSNPRAIWFSKN